MAIAIILMILGAVFFIYGLIIAFGPHGSLFFVIWFVLGVLFAAWGALRLRGFSMETMPQYIKNTVFLARIVLIVFLVLLMIVETLIISRFHDRAAGGADYLIVEGAQMLTDGPSPVLKYRLDSALDYLKDNPETICIVSGGRGKNEKLPEAFGMAEYLQKYGIDEERIIMEDQSGNTSENIKNSIRLFDPENSFTVIVTNDFHVFRSLGIAKEQGILNVSAIAADSEPLYLPNNLLREFLAVCKDMVFGNMVLPY